MNQDSCEKWSNHPRITPFMRRIFQALLQVPRGRVTTYGALGRAVGCSSAQAVGQALRRNPCAPSIPCHRVVRSDGSLGGFSGHSCGPEVQRKYALLCEEGVQFSAAHRVAAECIIELGRDDN